MKITSTTTIVLLLLALLVALVFNLPGKATFAGSHTVYKTRDASGIPEYGDAFFCEKCHPSIVGNVTGSIAHNSTACICHGYYPNYTKLYGPYGESGNYSINLKHNLTKNIYCTNCHTNYNDTGDIPIGSGVNARNQSAHYINLNSSNLSDIYVRAWKYFNRSFGPLD
ncbi:MAG: hypothetical protein V3T58_00055 [Candidatus Hydrothermarchaeales archaeon]